MNPFFEVNVFYLIVKSFGALIQHQNQTLELRLSWIRYNMHRPIRDIM